MFERQDRLAHAARGLDVITLLLQKVFQQSLDRGFVIDEFRPKDTMLTPNGTVGFDFPLDASGNMVSAFTRDETLIRAIAEHDFHMRHDEAVSVITGVVWA